MPLNRERLRNDIAEVLGEDPADLDDHEDLMDRGLDSIRALTLLTRWREDGFDVGFLDLASEPTVAAWVRLAEEAR